MANEANRKYLIVVMYRHTLTYPVLMDEEQVLKYLMTMIMEGGTFYKDYVRKVLLFRHYDGIHDDPANHLDIEVRKRWPYGCTSLKARESKHA